MGNGFVAYNLDGCPGLVIFIGCSLPSLRMRMWNDKGSGKGRYEEENRRHWMEGRNQHGKRGKWAKGEVRKERRRKERAGKQKAFFGNVRKERLAYSPGSKGVPSLRATYLAICLCFCALSPLTCK